MQETGFAGESPDVVPATADAAVEQLLFQAPPVAPTQTAREVADLFVANERLDAVPVVDGDHAIGLVTRSKLLLTLFRRFGFEVFGRKPITAIANLHPLVVRIDDTLQEVLSKALQRPEDEVYDEVLVADRDGRHRGLLSVKHLVLQQSSLLANTLLQRELATARARELEGIDRVKSRFIALVTHELRAPVNVMIGTAELCEAAQKKGDMQGLDRFLAMLQSSAAQLRTLVTNILDLSKIEAGRMEVVPELVDVVDLVREVAQTVRVLVKGRPIRVEVLAHEGPVIAETDRLRLRQVLTNLGSNAAKFTERGSIEFDVETPADAPITISVRDTGIGIRAEDQAQLFSAFSQVEDAASRVHDGTGLGLAITRQLLDLLGGTIEMHSVHGEGSSFIIRLPHRYAGRAAEATA
jgi:signal transduction histidine kinase